MSKEIESAKLLKKQHDERGNFQALPEHLTPVDDKEAYAIQDCLFDIRKAEHGDVAGYKVALTSEVMQTMLRYPSPFSGPLHKKLIYQSPKTLRSSDYGRLCIECELAAVVGGDIKLKDTPYSAQEIESYVSAIAPALEIVDDRNADYQSITQLVRTLIADNAWNAGVVVGDLKTNWRDIDIRNMCGTVSIGGIETGVGFGRDVLGDPMNALAWLANSITSRGKTIEEGMIIMTGTMIKTQFVDPGDILEFNIPELGSVTAEID
ncbi:MAG: fumarylacetoacetate hydrolase family protein [Betaproteobacteria bacterium]